MAEIKRKAKLIAYRNCLIDQDRCVNKASFRDLEVIYGLSLSTIHDILAAADAEKRKLKRSLLKPLFGNCKDAFDKHVGERDGTK